MKRRMAIVLALLAVGASVAVMFWRGRQPAASAAGAASAASMLQDLAGPPVSEPPPTALDRILSALKSGRIDYETSLLYRAYALMGDPRLPQTFHGAGGEDLAFFPEVRQNLTGLSERTQSELRPFLIRPSAPGSYFNRRRVSARRSSWIDALVAPIHAAPQSDECNEHNWLFENSTRFSYKVWACGSNARAEIRRTIAALDDLWDPMTAFMEKEPKHDAGGVVAGGDPRIDIYVVAFDTVAPGARDLEIGTASGVAVPEPEDGAVDSTGYLIINKKEREEFKSTVAHEFFHLLQFAHNHQILAKPIPGHEALIGGSGGTAMILRDRAWAWMPHWFVEASATWAEWFFVRPTAPEAVHTRFPTFQRNDHSLHVAEPSAHMYAAYVWPFFMRQQKGDPKTIARVWQAMPLAGDDWDRAMQILDRELEFATNFRIFTRRNINKPAWREALGPLYQEIDPSFPTNPPARWHPDEGVFLQASRNPLTHRVPDMRGLKAEYFAFGVRDDVKQLIFDFSGVGPVADLDVDMILKNRVTGKFTLKALESGESLVRLCRTFPDEDVIALAIVFNNHNTDMSKIVAGSFTVEARPEPCACGTVDIDVNWSKSDTVNATGTVETMRGRYSITVDAEGKVSSWGSAAHARESTSIMHQAFNTTTRVVGAGGKIDIGRIGPDGEYTITACTGPTETVDTGERSDTQRHTSEEGNCYQISATASQGDKLLAGRSYVPMMHRNQFTGYQEARVFSGRIGSSVFAGRASGGETRTWHFDVCAAPR